MSTENTGAEVARKPLPTARDLVAVLFRQRLTMLIVFVLVILAAAASGMWVPTYESKMKILVLHQRSDAIVTSSASLPAPFTADQVHEEDLNSEVELLNSEDLLRKVVLATGLDKPKKASSRAVDHNIAVERAVTQLGKDLQIEPGRKSNVITVSYSNHDPKLAAQVLQALSAAYTQKHLDLHHGSDEFNFFDAQAQQYLHGLDLAQAKLTEFTKETGVVSATTERDQALGHANEFDATARNAQTSILETERRIDALEKQLSITPARMTTVSRTADNPNLLQNLKTTLLTLQLKRTELLTKYEPTYRLVQEVDREIADAKASIAAADSQPIRDESTDGNPNYTWVKQELARARADLSGLKARQGSAASISKSYHQNAEQLDHDQSVQEQLQQDVKTEEENYLLYSHKREEARINDALDQRGIVNVAMAELPVVPAVPKGSLQNFVVAVFLLASVFSVAVAFALDMMNSTFHTPDDVTIYLGLPVLAAPTKAV